MPERVVDQINHDIAFKCGADVADAIRRNWQIAEGRQGMLMVAVAAASEACAMAAGAFTAVDGNDHPPLEMADALWATLIRPLVASAAGDRSEFQALIARWPDEQATPAQFTEDGR